ncbi:trehalose synthase [Drepanopeziza brunnea f. sp. 'multigermtubi' MB_m1]|uniref:Trehalose synthase n=1 Tax=Marssonina brunnea f. sp. multigermtubi (strain MB_m1) TaxID=1072389 RepID=K1WZB8_MARBU|nr:trehalose synthase [Drepanopeziza brunnea f. sp. 'multigermtubi' MB_m1]EKD13983.1 trehalose synthase [Drepanopeziza brunnea f. sp. 'multigermtubi' MB_m1]
MVDLKPTPHGHSALSAIPLDALEGTTTPPSRVPTPLRSTPKSLRPYVYALMAFKHGAHFQAKPSKLRAHRASLLAEKEGPFAPALLTLYAGIAVAFGAEGSAVVAVAIHDNTYLIDFSVQTIQLEDATGEDPIADYVVGELERYEHVNIAKFVGAGLPTELLKKAPKLCSRLWLDLDIVPISIVPELEGYEMSSKEKSFWNSKCVDEQADSMARKCIMHFGPSLAPLLQVGYRGIVEIDSGGRAHILSLDDFKRSCEAPTWDAMMHFVTSLKKAGTKIAFFSSTPQGGGVALMRHALVRLADLLGVDLTWYVPKPKPGVFRITKTMHNILQGVAEPGVSISAQEKQVLEDWIDDNAKRYWLSAGGPLRPVEEGGADVIMIDDPQMPGLIPLIKKITPHRPVLYRSHIQIRGDLAVMEGTPQADVWQFLWQNIKQADMFISHPIPSFVPSNVPSSTVAYLPATTDWLDGLNKPMNEWDQGYYGHIYNEQCHAIRMTQLKWPLKKYIIQVARFDPAKGIPDVIASYAEFRRLLTASNPSLAAPQLVICGNGSVDDPDGTLIFDQTMSSLETHFPSLVGSISVMRLAPNDQLLNTLLSAAHTVLQLSTREGFEVKVSEALHKGKPVIATRCGGIPLQLQHARNGFLVEPGDWRAVAGHLLELWTDDARYEAMSACARTSVSDEVGTVGNALAWFYLADRWANGTGVVPRERWVNDLAREEAGVPYREGENRLPRNFGRA